MHHTALRLDFLVNLWYNKNMRHQYWWRLFLPPHPDIGGGDFFLAKLKQKGFLHDTCFTNQTWHICCA